MRNRSRNIVIAIAAAVAVLSAIGGYVFTRSGDDGSPFNVGAVLPLTGSAAVWGKNSQQGMNLALKEINDGGGVKGRKLAILYEDSQSDPKTATSALQKLITVD